MLGKGCIWGVVLLVAANAGLAQYVNDAPPEWTEKATIELLAPREKRTGEPWDFGPACGGIVVPGPAGTGGFSQGAGGCFPDMWLVIIDSKGRSTAYLRRPNERRTESRNPLTMILRPASVMSMARCPDSIDCNYRDIRIPKEAFGIVVVDQDNSEHDFMLAAIMFTPGQVTDADIRQVEEKTYEYLEAMRAKGSLSGGPAPGEPLPVRPVSKCKDRFCLGGDTGGLAGVRLLVPVLQDFEGVACSVAPVKGELTFQRLSGLKTVLELHVATQNCTGDIDYSWDFGDGAVLESKTPDTVHLFDAPGTYTVTVTPRCVSGGRACTGTPIEKEIEIK